MRTSFGFVAAALVLAVAANAHASVAMSLSVEDMTDRADLIVRGKVTSQESQWTRAGRIVTTVHLAVDSGLKGQAPQTIDVEHRGGHVGKIGQQVEGEVAFTDGEEVLLFLRARPNVANRYVVIGLNQGKFHIERSATSVMATQKLDGLGLVQKPGGPITDATGGAALPLNELEARVTAHLHPPTKATP